MLKSSSCLSIPLSRRVYNHTGFTIIELAVVIVILGILATVGVYGFGAWQKRTAENVLKSDLTMAASQLAADLNWQNSYPDTELAANSGKGLPKSEGTIYEYTRVAANQYCLSAYSDKQGFPSFHISSSSSTPQEGLCEGHEGPMDPGGSHGKNWTVHQVPEKNNWNSLAYGNGRFVAVANANAGNEGVNRIMTSVDNGQTWTGYPSPDENVSWQSIAYGNGRFVAVGTKTNPPAGLSVAMTSTDGRTWAAYPLSTGSVVSIAYGNNRFVAVGAAGTYRAYSADGQTWARVSSGTAQSQNIAYGNGRFVAAPFSTNPTYSISTDGQSWNVQPSPSGSWGVLGFGRGKFVMKGGVDDLATSVDGVNWVAHPSPSSRWGWYASIAYGNGHFVAVGNSNEVLVSIDGQSWIEEPAHPGWWKAVAYGDGCFVAVAGGNHGPQGSAMRSCQ